MRCEKSFVLKGEVLEYQIINVIKMTKAPLQTAIFAINPTYSVCYLLYLGLSGFLGQRPGTLTSPFSVVTDKLASSFKFVKVVLLYHSVELNFLVQSFV